MEQKGNSVKKPFARTVKVETADLASAPSVILDLGSPAVVSTSAFSASLAATTYVAALAVTGDATVTGTITIPANVDTIAELVAALSNVDAGTDFVATFVAGNTVTGVNSHIVIQGTAAINATSVTGSNLGVMTTLDTLAANILAQWGLGAYKRNATNGVWHQVSMLISNEPAKTSTKGSVMINLGNATVTAASTFPGVSAGASSNLVVKGEVNGTFAIATGAIVAATTTIANVVTAMDATSGITATFVPATTGVSAKIKLEIDTAGENTSIDYSDFLAASELVAVLTAGLVGITTGVVVETPVLGTSAFDKLNFIAEVKSSTGEPQAGFISLFDRNTGKLIVKDGSTGVLAAGQTVTYFGSFSK